MKIMKKSLIMLIFCFFAVAVKAQLPKGDITLPATLVMPDGSVVPRKSMDSIKKVFGGRDVSFSFLADGTVHIHPVKNKTEQVESDASLAAHLNKLAPEFAFKDINGNLVSLAHLKGKIVVLNFWFTACGGCITEMPDLNELKKGYDSKNYVFLAITYDDNIKVNNFLAKNKFDYTIIPNANEICKEYNIDAYPASMVIDRDGIVRFIYNSVSGDVKSQLTKAIDEAKNNSYSVNK